MAEGITLKPISFEWVEVPIEGIAPLVTHNWSEKAKQMMRDKQQGITAKKKEPKDPEQEYLDAFYRLPDGSPGMPAAAFKAATVGGARLFENVTMVTIKQAMFFSGEGPEQLVRIVGDPEFYEAPVRVGMGVADLRYRPRFFPWSAVLRVKFNADMLSVDALVNLIEAGGMGGVGEWRPSAPKSATGSYGTYGVVR